MIEAKIKIYTSSVRVVILLDCPVFSEHIPPGVNTDDIAALISLYYIVQDGVREEDRFWLRFDYRGPNPDDLEKLLEGKE